MIVVYTRFSIIQSAHRATYKLYTTNSNDPIEKVLSMITNYGDFNEF